MEAGAGPEASVATVVEAVQALHYDADRDRKSAADTWLMAFQKTDAAWMACRPPPTHVHSTCIPRRDDAASRRVAPGGRARSGTAVFAERILLLCPASAQTT